MGQRCPSVARFSLLGRWSNGRPVVNVLHYHVTPVSDRAAAVQYFAAYVGDTWQDEVLDQMADNYSFEGTHYLDLDNEAGVTGTIAANTAKPVTGAITGGSAAAPQNAYLVTKQHNVGKRNVRKGRIYVPVGNEVSVDEQGKIISGQLTVLQSVWTTFFNLTHLTTPASQVAAAHMVTVHWPSIPDPKWSQRPVPKVPDPDGVGIPTDVTQLTVEQTTATQRRRLRP